MPPGAFARQRASRAMQRSQRPLDFAFAHRHAADDAPAFGAHAHRLALEPGRQGGKCDSGYACAYSNNISWRSDTTPSGKEINPRLVFERLFASANPKAVGEAAVRREILEEAGVPVDEMTYLGSQPWPFPCSLMLGYHAWATSTDIAVDGEEIVEARWFSRAELAAACASGEVALPPAVSIARRLIERWFGEPLNGDWIRP